MRFFGKFFGSHADYFVFETTLKAPPTEPADAAAQLGACARSSDEAAGRQKQLADGSLQQLSSTEQQHGCACAACSDLPVPYTPTHRLHVVAAEGEVPTEWNSGANGYVYWVANQLGGPLTQLPPVTPAQVPGGCAKARPRACVLDS